MNTTGPDAEYSTVLIKPMPNSTDETGDKQRKQRHHQLRTPAGQILVGGGAVNYHQAKYSDVARKASTSVPRSKARK